MKDLTLKTIALVAILSCGASAMASDRGLEPLRVSDIRASRTGFSIPVPPPVANDDLIGVSLVIRLPYKAVKRGFELMAAANKEITIVDANAPVMSKSGDFLKIVNIQVDVNGIIVTPTIILKPYMEGRDKLAIRILRVQLHASLEPDVKSAPAPALDPEELAAQVMESIINSVQSSIDGQLGAGHGQYQAKDMLKMNYDKASWTLHMDFSYGVMSQLIPAGLVGEMHLADFSSDGGALNLLIQTGK